MPKTRNLINKDEVKRYIEMNHKEVSNADLTTLECLVFGIIFDWIQKSKGKTLCHLSYKMIAAIARKGRNWKRKIIREAEICLNCKKIRHPAWLQKANEESLRILKTE